MKKLTLTLSSKRRTQVGKKKRASQKRKNWQGQVLAVILAAAMLVSLVGLYLGSSGQSVTPSAGVAGGATADRFVDQGNRAYDAGNYAAAIRAYEQAVASGRDRDPGVLTDLGTAYFYRTPSDPVKAIEYYDRALAVAPDFPNAQFNKGIVLYQGQRKLAEAISVWEKLMTSLPANDPSLPRVKGLIAEAQAELARTQAPASAAPAGGSPVPAAPAPSSPPAAPGAQGGSRLSGGFGR